MQTLTKPPINWEAYKNIPKEMLAYPSWVIWRSELKIKPDGTPELNADGSFKMVKPLYNPNNLRHASHSNPSHWSDANFALQQLYSHQDKFEGLGFVFSDNDPYCGIDIDKIQQGNSQFKKEAYEKFNTYCEWSPSASGLHLITKGKFPFKGVKKHGVEMYCRNRYFTMTGNIFEIRPINENIKELEWLYQQLDGSYVPDSLNIVDDPEIESDQNILTAIYNSNYRERFGYLWNGNFPQYFEYIENTYKIPVGDKSQSAADLAFINIIAKYTRNKAQAWRLFLYSGLGQREKAKRTDYFHVIWSKAFDLEYLENLLPRYERPSVLGLLSEPEPVTSAQPEPESEPTGVLLRPEPEPMGTWPFPLPGGTIGELAQFILDNSISPVPEIALLGAISIFSAIVARNYEISKTGLNFFSLLLAPPGIGKNEIKRAGDALFAKLQSYNKNYPEFMGKGDYSSHQAISRYMTANPCFLWLFSDGLSKLKEIMLPKNELQEGISTFIRNAYTSSGKNSCIKGRIYSDSKKDTHDVAGPALSILIETAPVNFWQLINNEVINNGFLSRFCIVNYTGKIPYQRGIEHRIDIPDSLFNKLLDIGAKINQINDSDLGSIELNFSDDLLQYDDDLNKNLVDYRNCLLSENSVLETDLLSRTRLKLLRLAGLLAVSENHDNPVLKLEHYLWAENYIKRSDDTVLDKLRNDEVGEENTELLQLNVVIKLFKDIATYDSVKLNAYLLLEKHKINNCATFRYLHTRALRNSIFKKDKRGVKRALELVLELLMKQERIVKLTPYQSKALFGNLADVYKWIE